MIGRTLAHYEITSLLGKGGMGEVYRARDMNSGAGARAQRGSTQRHLGAAASVSAMWHYIVALNARLSPASNSL